MKLATSFWLVAVSFWHAEAKIRGVNPNASHQLKERKLQQLMGYGGEPPAFRYPLGLCEGDCDTDDHCAGSLVCYQRNKKEEAPGCEGGESFDADTDFCAPAVLGATETFAPTFAPTSAPTFAPTSAPTFSPATDAPTFSIINAAIETPSPVYMLDTNGFLFLVFVGDDITSGLPLGMCQGDCDTDDDCLDDFVCFQREMFEPVPGCAGEGDVSIDYCTKDWSGGVDITTTMAPVPAPTVPEQPVGGSATLGEDLPLLTTVGDELGLPLGVCEGDCDSDDDCLDTLVCFQRDMMDPVPGCSGQGRISYDYCILGPTSIEVTEVITSAPSTTVPGPVVEVNPLSPPLEIAVDVDFSVIGTPLGFCQGECNTDDDCLDDLVCYQRDAFETVPGCSGSGEEGMNYCTVSLADDFSVSVSFVPEPTDTLPPELQGDDLSILVTVGDNLPLPLGMCQGDCDNDDDCLDELVCFQRDLLDPVPGCSGEGQISYDYCTVAPGATLAPMTPTVAPNASPTNAPDVPVSQLPPLETVGDDLELPLGICQGDCDSDDDCLDDLVCFQRNMLEPVEGCSGDGQISYDYCTNGVGSTPSPTLPPATQQDPVDDSQLPPLESVSNDGNPIGLCQGDCDTDDDCLDEFVCFQRDFLEPVPGCSGLGERSYDYCIIDPLSDTTILPTSAPVAMPEPTPDMPTESLPQLVVIGDSLGLPLGMCEGDCDSDEDCLDEFVCFQRDLLEPVPGCGGTGRTSYDYCTVDSSSAPGPTSVPAPAPVPTVATTETDGMPSVVGPQLVEISDEGTVALGLCEGDCDSDTDCLDTMICFQRNYLEPVPFCSGTGRASYDYCITDPNLSMPTGAPLTVSPVTNPPVVPQPETAPPTDNPFTVVAAEEAPKDGTQELPPLVFVDSKDDKKDKYKETESEDEGLGLCEGACEYTEECAPGLFCYDGGEAATSVPGCSGNPFGYSFCIPVPGRRLKGVRRGRSP